MRRANIVIQNCVKMSNIVVLALLAAVVSANAFQPMSFRHFASRIEPTLESIDVTAANISLHTIEQHIDNFDPTNHATFQQRYYTNSEFYRPGGPLYVFLSGEWAITPTRLTASLMAEMAAELNGHISYLEHRYYGESFPVDSLTDVNLQFLTPYQALADTAHFVADLKSTLDGAADSPVIVIGAHYSGTLAAWFRQKFPHLAVAAWASSAPVLSVIDQHEFKELAAEAYRNIGGDRCYDALESGFAEMEQMVVAERFDELFEMFNLCEPLVTRNDVSTFFAEIAEFYAIIAQFATVASLNAVCNMVQSAPTPAAGIALILSVMMEEPCINANYQAIVDFDRQTSLDAPSVRSGVRQATYQTCTQVGWHHTSGSEFQPFGSQFPIEFFNQACEDVFGAVYSRENAQEDSDRINVVHGGLNPAVTNVIFTQGTLDPWRSLGVQEDLNDAAPAIFIENASQANDLAASNERDSPALRDAKLRIKELLHLWIEQARGGDIEEH